MSSRPLSEIGELGLLASSSGAGSPWASSTTRPSIEGLVVTQDALVEGVHFRLDRTSWRDLGFKAAAVNISDLAASGAEADGLVVSSGSRRTRCATT